MARIARSLALGPIPLCLLAAGCAPGADVDRSVALSAVAYLRDAAGRRIGSARIVEEADGLRLAVQATGLRAGPTGIHLHAVGRCDPPGFESAGPHWNPANRQHGAENMQGVHVGDLPNLLAGRDGRAMLDVLIPSVGLTGDRRPALLDADGTALVVHASADDYRTDPSGNSGSRVACGVFAPAP